MQAFSSGARIFFCSLKLPKRGGNGASQRERGGGGEREEKKKKKKSIFSPLPPFLFSPLHLPKGVLFLLSPISLCHKIKDGGYNSNFLI